MFQKLQKIFKPLLDVMWMALLIVVTGVNMLLMFSSGSTTDGVAKGAVLLMLLTSGWTGTQILKHGWAAVDEIREKMKGQQMDDDD